MGKYTLFVYASVLLLKFAAVNTQLSENGKARSKVSHTRFSCLNRVSGYYADVDTGCQVYHMCDGLGRQFSYKCPNMTLFQQRMLICDHWYMVNCSMSERDYGANLLIGQRDKPFVSDDEMRLRTPRPDILSAPPYNPYYDVLRESDTKFTHPGNSIVGVADTIADVENDDLDIGKQTYRPPTAWSTGTRRQTKANTIGNSNTIAYSNKITSSNTKAGIGSSKIFDTLDQAASQEPDATFRPTPRSNFLQSKIQNVTPPSIELVPPAAPTTDSSESDEDTSSESTEANVFKFIKRFDPTAPDVQQTAMTKSEIIDLNGHLPDAPATSEEDRTPRKHKNFGNKGNTFQTENDKTFTEGTKFNSVNTKSTKPDVVTTTNKKDEIPSSVVVPEPEKTLLPPKIDSAPFASTTVGPPIYYDWKWAVPAFGLTPPKAGNTTRKHTTNTTTTQTNEHVQPILFQGLSPFRSVTRPEPKTTTPEPSNVEYNISSYFIPDYVFPLDKAHPGYEGEEAETSFQVKIANPGRRSFGENSECPQCHPAYLNPGSCEPCIVKR